ATITLNSTDATGKSVSKTFEFVAKTGDTITSGNVEVVLGADINATLDALGTAAISTNGFDGKGVASKGAAANKKISFTSAAPATDPAAGTNPAYAGVTIAGTSGIGLNLQIGDTATQRVSVNVTSMSTKTLKIDDVDVGTEAGATTAIDKIKTAINSVSGTRADLGAIQNRLEHTINNLTTTTENMTAAESRIRDTDMAKEMMAFTKNNVLAQAAQSMLAQANQQPQQVLQLLNKR
ncbi:MAG: flagellin, partial [Oscillospiraceae bacterium]